MKNDTGKWLLWCGIHKGTLISRDAAEPTQHKTREEALEEFVRCRTDLWRAGYMIWFAKLISPEGEEEIIDYGELYQ